MKINSKSDASSPAASVARAAFSLSWGVCDFLGGLTEDGGGLV